MGVIYDLAKKVEGHCESAFVGVCIGVLLTLGISFGCGFFKSGQDRTSNGELTKDVGNAEGTVELLEREIGILRDELSAANARLSENQSTLGAVRKCIEECKQTVEDGFSDITTIREATERIRAEIVILQDFYDSVCDIYDSIDNSDSFNIEEVKK